MLMLLVAVRESGVGEHSMYIKVMFKTEER